ncbi:MAG TPA: hypothetical protein VMU19_05895, partial [Bryobacteraceae bacterium]|nr:hypothetical protein [Bryobacteraceae bacterium]
MAATVKPLGLYDLLAPQFGLGFQFPSYIDKYLSQLAVADFTGVSDAAAILYTGTVYWPSPPGQPPVLTHQDPSGAIFDIHEASFQFRLLIPRTGSDELKTCLDFVQSNASSLFPPSLQPIEDGVFGAPSSPPTGPTDYPGIAFQLELLVNILTFHMGPDWKPAVMNSEGSVSADPGSPPNSDVRILMPQILLRYTQVQDFSQAPKCEIAAWGNPGFDAPNDLAEGQLATMDPPLAIHSSGRVAFGIQTIVLDLSPDNTPSSLLQYFGVDQSFEGLYAKAIQVYYTDTNKDFALNFLVRDALVSFKGEVWLEAELDLIFDAFTVNVTAWYGSSAVPVNAGSQINPGAWSGGSITIPSGGALYLQTAGGVPPYTQSVVFTPTGGTATTNLWQSDICMALFPASSTTEQGTLVISIHDSSVPPQTYKNTLNCILAADTDANPLADAPAPPQASANPKPGFLRRLSIQLQIEKNEFVRA